MLPKFLFTLTAQAQNPGKACFSRGITRFFICLTIKEWSSPKRAALWQLACFLFRRRRRRLLALVQENKNLRLFQICAILKRHRRVRHRSTQHAQHQTKLSTTGLILYFGHLLSHRRSTPFLWKLTPLSF